MNKSKYVIYSFLLCFSLCLAFTSCLKDDNNDIKVDEVWKNRNAQIFKDAKLTGEYDELISPLYAASNLYILAKPDSAMALMQDRANRTRAYNYDVVEFKDSVYCRYTGWFIDRDGKKYIFDSTEIPVTGGYVNPNSVPRGFLVSNVIEGWRTALYNMKVGDELEIVIPYTLGYGTSGASAIPGYTTLYFDIKLTKLVKMKGLS